MKTKLLFLFIFAFINFYTLSAQKNSSAHTGLNSHVSGNIGKVVKGNPNSVVIPDQGKISPQLEHNWLLDSVYMSDWDATSWVLKTINHRYYNSNEWLHDNLYIVKKPVTGIWTNYAHFLYSYTGVFQDTSAVRGQIWTNASTWVDFQYTHYLKRNFVDTTYTKDWSPLKQKFVSGTRLIYSYDTLDAISQNLTQNFDTTSSVWKDNYRITYTYTATHLPSEEIFQNWNSTSSVWDNINRKVDNYDTSNFLIEHIEYVWNDTASTWQNSSRITYSNNPAGNPVISLTESWNNLTSAWEPVIQSTYNYNDFGWKLSEWQRMYNSGTTLYDDYYLFNYFYFQDGILQSTQGQFWKPLTHEWIVDSYYILDSNLNLTEEYTKYHDNSTYEISDGLRIAYTYSPVMPTRLYQVWSKITNDWLNNEFVTDSINENKLLAQTLDVKWDTASSTWKNNKLSIYYYSKSSEGIEETGNDRNLCRFANPMKVGSVINCPGLTTGASYNLKMYSLSGALVYSTPFVGGNSVRMSASVPEGLYMLQFTTENGKVLTTNKVIVIR
jgi:hypothetical protein